MQHIKWIIFGFLCIHIGIYMAIISWCAVTAWIAVLSAPLGIVIIVCNLFRKFEKPESSDADLYTLFRRFEDTDLNDPD